MCLAIPVQITRLLPEQRAVVNLAGIEREISTVLLEAVNSGDYVIIHVGYALTRLDEREALKTLDLLGKMHDEIYR